MKIQIEIPDLQTIYTSYYEEDEITSEDLAKAIFNDAKSEFIRNLYNNYVNDKVYDSISSEVAEIIKNNQKEIIDRVVNSVSSTILRKKIIVQEMPKKSEVANISKEWEKYFLELIDKAIAKRFKS